MPPGKQRGRLVPDLLGTGARLASARVPAPSRIRVEPKVVSCEPPRKISGEAKPGESITPAMSLSAMPLDWPGLGKSKKPRGPVEIAPVRTTSRRKTARTAMTDVFQIKGAATALGFRPAYWSYDCESIGSSLPSTRTGQANPKSRQNSS